MNKAHQAGALILNNLKNFNESVVYFETVVAPSIEGGVDSCVSSFCGECNGWEGEYDLAGDYSNCWLAPEAWNTTPGEKNPVRKAWFEVSCINGDYDWWSSLFCGVGVRGGEAGFMFRFQPKEFGGKVNWKNFVKKQQSVVGEIEKLGFKNQNDGTFFLPVRLDASNLANTWDEAGKLQGDDDCFQPVRDALEKIAKSVPLFDELMQSCQGTSKKK